jgi:hypothetical protein
MDDDKCGEICGMIGRGNLSADRKPAQVPLCPPQIPHDLNLKKENLKNENKLQVQMNRVYGSPILKCQVSSFVRTQQLPCSKNNAISDKNVCGN